MTKQKLIHAAIATAVTVGMGLTAMQATAAATSSKAMEKCYGVADVGKNDCGTATHACAGQAKIKNDPNEWMLVAKGTCIKMHGSLTAGGKTKPVDKKTDTKSK